MHQQSETSILQLGGITTPIFDKPTSDPNALGLRAENLNAEGDSISLLSEGLDRLSQLQLKEKILSVKSFCFLILENRIGRIGMARPSMLFVKDYPPLPIARN